MVISDPALTMNHVEDVFGIRLKYLPFDKERLLPLFLLDAYRIEYAQIDGMKLILLHPRHDLGHIQSIKKHISHIQAIENVPVVLVLPSITRQRRESFMNAGIPFIIQDAQAYLPFLGIKLQERFAVRDVGMLRLQPATQVLFFHYIYSRKTTMFLQEAVHNLGYSAMTISRSITQLAQTNHIIADKEGVRRFFYSPLRGKELFSALEPFLINPVRSRTYMAKKDITEEYLLAGESALTAQSMIEPPPVPCYAGIDSIGGSDELLDSEHQVRVEVWKYDPGILSNSRIVDPLSLYMSYVDERRRQPTLFDISDERVEESLEQVLNNLWERLSYSR
ncbi:MAG TPA: hypothetical protein PLF67_08460 [Sphaerochaeta sp.]|nr:hypothetical protein [Sphaerochaeta sp.]